MVGGAVRDTLMGQVAGDRDWVVVGADPDTMLARGFQPVGADFPVFLHPVTKEEYALARTERKSGRGYKGFTFYTGTDVTLLDDLKRRDLTINAMAQTPDGILIDPLDGRKDIQRKRLRHVGQAFSEDPVRLLRLARFAARFPDFSVAEETMRLACQLVADGEVDALVPERVWQEVSKGLLASQPGRMLEVLEQTGALPKVLPGLVWSPGCAAELACAATAGLPLASRYALLCRHTPTVKALSARLRAPRQCMDYATLLPRLVRHLEHDDHGAESQLHVLTAADALRRPDRFIDLLQAVHCVQPVDVSLWTRRMQAVRGLDAGAIAQAAAGDPSAIQKQLKQARLHVLESLENVDLKADGVYRYD